MPTHMFDTHVDNLKSELDSLAELKKILEVRASIIFDDLSSCMTPLPRSLRLRQKRMLDDSIGFEETTAV